MAQQKFGTDRYLPEGEWIAAVDAAAVAGTKFRKNQVNEFAKAVKSAEEKGLEYGLELEPEPDNRADPLVQPKPPGWAPSSPDTGLRRRAS